MNTRQKYGHGNSHANPAASAAKKPDKKTQNSGKRLEALQLTPFSDHSRIRAMIAKLSINEMDLYVDFVFGYPDEQKGGVSNA